jgi:hypothetical protein
VRAGLEAGILKPEDFAAVRRAFLASLELCGGGEGETAVDGGGLLGGDEGPSEMLPDPTLGLNLNLAEGKLGGGGGGGGTHPFGGARDSAVDGYAVRAADCPGTLMVKIFFGEVAPGEAARVAAGAPLPPGADAVVPSEHCDKLQSPFGPAVYIPAAVNPGAGCDGGARLVGGPAGGGSDGGSGDGGGGRGGRGGRGGGGPAQERTEYMGISLVSRRGRGGGRGGTTGVGGAVQSPAGFMGIVPAPAPAPPTTAPAPAPLVAQPPLLAPSPAFPSAPTPPFPAASSSSPYPNPANANNAAATKPKPIGSGGVGMSGIGVAEESLAAFADLKKKRAVKYAIFKVSEGHGAVTAGTYHLLTIVHVFKPHLGCCLNLFTTTESTTLIAA